MNDDDRPVFLSANQPADPKAELRATIEVFAMHERTSGHLLRRGYEYAGMHDFVLREGTWFDAPTEPHSYRQGAPKKCFANSINASIYYGFRYVEGIGCTSVAPDLPVHHAWNLDDDGNVVDLTWGAYRNGVCIVPIGIAYCGVEFSAERADDATWNGDASTLDDYNREWPLLKEKWNGEPADLEWPSSIRLDAVRAYRDGDPEKAEALYDQMESEL